MDAVKEHTSFPKGMLFVKNKVVNFRANSNNTDSPKDYKNAEMFDAYINYQPKKESIDKYNDFSINNDLLFLGVSVAHSLGKRALEKGAAVAQKVKTTAATAKMWAVFLGMYKVFDSVTKKIPVLNEFRKDHPMTASFGIILGAVFAGEAAEPVVDKIASKIAKIKVGKADLGSKIKTETQKLMQRFGEVIDNKLFKPTEKILETKPIKFIRNPYVYIPLLVGSIAAIYYTDKAKINNINK